MIGRIYRLTQAKKIEMFQRELTVGEDDIIVRPTYLSICAADLRYYFGHRNKEAMAKKLPMALIHEAVAMVCYDPQKQFKKGQSVVLIPNIQGQGFAEIKANYRPTSTFLSSGKDGFMQDLISINRDRVVLVPSNVDQVQVYALSELLSIAYNAISGLPRSPRGALCVFGNGSVGFVCALALKYTYPNLPLIVIGTNPHKLQYFSFADERYMFDSIPPTLSFDMAFECVGGAGVEDVFDEIIDHILPQGIIALLGVSENRIPINTRLILEKGLTICGYSRSEKEDFEAAVKLISEYPEVAMRIYTIISRTIDVKSISDLMLAFEQAQNADFKTLMNWKV